MLLGGEGNGVAFLFLYMSTHVTFFLAQWEEQHTHVLRSNLLGLLGVTEVQWLQIGLVLINAFSG